MGYRILGTFIGFAFAVFAAIIFLKVDTTQEHATPFTGNVISVSEGPSFDILFQLDNHELPFYINRGLETGLKVDSLSNELVGKNLTLWVGRQLIGTPRHITHLEHGRIIYSEW